jgi:hypothetical protein
MDIVCEQEILVITYLFPDPKYDILITSSAKADFYSLKYEFRWIANVTSSLHDLLPGFKKPCKTKFRESRVTPESRKLILQTLLKPEFTLTKKLNIVSGYVSIETDRTPSPKNGHAKRRPKQFCKICKSYFHLWLRIYSEWRQLFFTS